MTDNKGPRPADDWRDDDISDADVSRVYREAAGERTPAHLDDAVLATARREAKSPYERSIRWLRPMAWAATVGLCLAIVIDVSLVPEFQDSARFDQPLGSPDVGSMSKPLATSSDPIPAADRMQKAREETQPESLDESMGRYGPGNADAPRASEPGLVEFEPAEDIASAAFEDKVVIDQQRLERAAPEAREAATAEVSSSLGLAPPSDFADAICPQEILRDPVRWLECIAALRSEERIEDAEREMRLFERRFPNYALD